jgi:hypothetical protein
MFRRTARPSPFWPAAALLALLATPHTLLAQDAPPTVRAEVTNQTGKPIEFALVGPDGKDYGPTRTVKPSEEYRTSNRTLPPGSAKGYKWVVREPDTGRVLKDVPADRAQQSISVGIWKRIDVPAGSGAAQTPPVAAQVTAIPEAVRKKFNLDPSFYKKHIDYKGFSILSSAKVSDKALLEARYLIDKLLGDREDILKAMIKNDCRFMVMAPTEMTTDVPERTCLP